MLHCFNRPKCCVSVIGAALVFGSWTVADLSAQRPSDRVENVEVETKPIDCPACDGGRLFVPQTGDPKVDRDFRQALRDAMAAKRARSREEAQQEHLRKREIWQGTTAMIVGRRSVDEMAQALRHRDNRTTVDLPPHAGGVADAQRESLAPFVELFAKQDPPAPDGRREHFAEFLQPDSPDRCVGWDCRLSLAEEVDDGWLVHMEVLSKLMAINWNYVVTFRSTYEVWHVNRDGKLTPVEVTPGEGGILGRG